jgi:hypothetical protein
MDLTAAAQLNAMIQQRHLELWSKIVSSYEVDPSLNTRVRKWILDGVFSEKAASGIQIRTRAALPT